MAVFKLNEDNYGGIFDIDDDIFFTKEEIVEFGNDIAEEFDTIHNNNAYLLDVYFDTPKILHLDITDDEYEYPIEVRIDMRKIRSPRDIDKYKKQVLAELEKQYEDYHQYDNYYESYKLKESNGYNPVDDFKAITRFGVKGHGNDEYSIVSYSKNSHDDFLQVALVDDGERCVITGSPYNGVDKDFVEYALGRYLKHTGNVLDGMDPYDIANILTNSLDFFKSTLNESYKLKESNNFEDVWTAVCSGDLENVKRLVTDYEVANKRWDKFGKNHSLIMGAARNNEPEVVTYLLNLGGTIEPHETYEFADFVKNNSDVVLKGYSFAKEYR